MNGADTWFLMFFAHWLELSNLSLLFHKRNKFLHDGRQIFCGIVYHVQQTVAIKILDGNLHYLGSI